MMARVTKTEALKVIMDNAGNNMTVSIRCNPQTKGVGGIFEIREYQTKVTDEGEFFVYQKDIYDVPRIKILMKSIGKCTLAKVLDMVYVSVGYENGILEFKI